MAVVVVVLVVMLLAFGLTPRNNWFRFIFLAWVSWSLFFPSPFFLSWGWHFSSSRVGDLGQGLSQQLQTALHLGPTTHQLEVFDRIHFQGNATGTLLIWRFVPKYASLPVWTTTHDQICLFAQFDRIRIYRKGMVCVLNIYYSYYSYN